MNKEDLIRKAEEEEAEIERESGSESEGESGSEEEESESEEEESEEEKKGVPDEVRTQRWFSDPMFEALASKKEEESDEEAIQAMKDAQRKSVKRALPLEERLRAYSGRWRGW